MPGKRPQAAASGLLIENDSVLLVKRGYEPSAGQWAAPGGKVEWGEPLEAAMVRELTEETGLSVCSQGQLATFETVNRDQAGEITHHFIIHMFRCGRLGAESGAGALTPRGADDAVDARMVPFAELPQYEITRTTLKGLRIAGLAIDSLVDFRVHLAVPADVPLVKEILHRAFAVEQLRQTYIPGSLVETDEDIAADIAAGVTWIGLFRGTPVAIGRLKPRADASHVTSLAVDYEYQGLGLGRRMRLALEECR